MSELTEYEKGFKDAISKIWEISERISKRKKKTREGRFIDLLNCISDLEKGEANE